MNVTLNNLTVGHVEALYQLKNDNHDLENIPGEYPLDRTLFANGNIASGRVLKKAGFHFCGEIEFTLSDGMIVMDNQWLILL